MEISSREITLHLVDIELAISIPPLQKWCLSGTWLDSLTTFLQRHKGELDLSSVDLDGSHTPAIRGGQNFAFQGRKKRKTTNALYLTDRQGLPLAIFEPVIGNHNDLYNIEVQFEVVTATW